MDGYSFDGGERVGACVSVFRARLGGRDGASLNGHAMGSCVVPEVVTFGRGGRGGEGTVCLGSACLRGNYMIWERMGQVLQVTVKRAASRLPLGG